MQAIGPGANLGGDVRRQIANDFDVAARSVQQGFRETAGETADQRAVALPPTLGEEAPLSRVGGAFSSPA